MVLVDYRFRVNPLGLLFVDEIKEEVLGLAIPRTCFPSWSYTISPNEG